ncbi:MAG: DUF402 domain-containing protein [Lachnospiraceae bacterium]|nr:DUF402 domain-containing protein [Lachnospiraceae bacterium]MBR5766519.1 DUF402 domain-containing protein [Lachnospiraceae bacterium]MBR6469482.1 DUF402 domain-containing protein [Lachnospiraceae bacterium]MBR6487167.1 DUF402 domain-containing protein [Lachnospiraceae bacterium]
MEKPHFYRKRIIPEECIPLKDDIILKMTDDIIITKWNTLRPKKNMHHGYSCYFLKEGYKVSKFLREDNSLLYWYCDIIKTDYDSSTNTYVFTDLLADVIMYPDGFVKVVDIDEIAEALKSGKLPPEDVISLLTSLDKLLKIVYSEDFEKYKHMINEYALEK